VVSVLILKGHKGGFATLAERKSRLYLALPIANKTAQNANDAINKRLTPLKHWVKTLTFDSQLPVANASASINNTGALINVNAIRYPTSIIIFAIAFSIFRNTGKRGYRHKQANRLADERHQEKNKAIKLTDSVKNYISEKLKEYWSPEQIMIL
jgi:IS30 family transposase